MSKYIGPIIAWVVIAGIILFVVRHLPDILGGASYVEQLGAGQRFIEAIEKLFK